MRKVDRFTAPPRCEPPFTNHRAMSLYIAVVVDTNGSVLLSRPFLSRADARTYLDNVADFMLEVSSEA
jgi:hypothetical protein